MNEKKIKIEKKEKTKMEIIILTWNNLEYTKKALSSIIATTEKPRFIFVDNGSTDGTLEFLESIPRSTVLNVKCGFAEAVNKGLSECITKYPIVCNNDIIVKDAWATNLIHGMESNPKIKVMVTTTDNCGERMQWFPSKDCVKPSVIMCGEINMVCFAIDRVYWLENKLDEHYLSGVEDIDYCWNVKEKGFYSGVCLASFVHHEGSVTNKNEYGIKANLNLKLGWKYFANKWGVKGMLRSNEFFKCKDTVELKKVISE